MRIHKFEQTQFLQCDLATAWSFFSSPSNLSKITPPKMDFKVTSNPPPKIYPGLIITYKVSPIGPLQLDWVSEITHVVEGKRFIDVQRAGPYRFWHHQHEFVESGDGVLMTDTVYYGLPFQPYSELFHKLLVLKNLRAIFSFREKKILELFPTSGH